MQRKGIGIVLAVGLLGACTNRQFEELPIDVNTKAVLMLVQDPNGSVMAAEAMVVGQPWLLERAKNDNWVATALLYDLELDALGLTPGELQIANTGEQSQPLPTPDGIFDRWLEDDDPWRLLTNLPARLETIRLKASRTDVRLCADQGGCFVNATEACALPCPDATVPDEPDEPEAVNRPELRPCRAGWGPDDTESMCLPPSAVEPTCPAGTFQSLGQATCQPLGRACVAPWPPDEELRGAGEVWYVQPTSAGNGTRASPFGTLGQALAASAPGDVIALSTGVHPEAGPLLEGRTLAGACVAQTVLTGGLQVLGTDVTLQDLTIDGIGLRVETNGSATATGIAIDTTGTAVEVAGGTLALHAARITATEDALYVTNAGQLTLDTVRIDGPRQTGLFATGIDTNVTASDLWIRPANGRAVQVTGWARVRLEGVWLEGGEEGVHGEGEQTHVFVSDGRLTNSSTQAISIRTGAFEAHRMSVTETPLGLSAQSRARIMLSDTHFARIAGRGLDLRDLATLTANRLHIDAVLEHALFGANQGRWTIEDLTVKTVTGGSRIGIRTNKGQRILLSRAHFSSDAREAIRLEETPFTGEDITTEAGLERGVVVLDSPEEVILRRLFVTETNIEGIEVKTSRSLQIEDAHIVRPGGPGIFIDNTATEMDRIRIDQPSRRGLLALFARPIEVRDLVVEGAVENPDPASVNDPDCPYRGVELAASSYGILERFTVTNGDCIGIELKSSGGELRQGLIARHPIGTQIGALRDAQIERVRFEDNIINVFSLRD